MTVIEKLWKLLLPTAQAPIANPLFQTGDRVEYIDENVYPPHHGTVMWCWGEKIKVQWDGFAQMRWVDLEDIRRL